MQRLEVSDAVRQLYGSLGVKGLICYRLRPEERPIRPLRAVLMSS